MAACERYYVMRYEAFIEGGGWWDECSQVGSAKLISDRVQAYEAQPDLYRNIRTFVTRETEVSEVPVRMV